MNRSFQRRERSVSGGFTLIELMIVVAIIGILAAIGIPMFTAFQNRARQSEAKVSLKAYFTAAKASFAETGRWRCGACGWSPQDENYLYDYFLSSTISFEKDTRGCGAGIGVAAMQTDPNGTSGELGGFTAEATANLDTDAVCDAWNIHDGALLTNPSSDVDD